jgi:short-subunit dehydrogenase
MGWQRNFSRESAMTIELKPLDQQTIVITGASSGIGLATARAAAKAGARVMLAARDGEALAKICRDIEAEGGTADHVVTDVGDEQQVEELARRTIERFGGFDTWVNNAGVGLITTVEKMSPEDHQALFRTNYFGLVYGSIAAVNHFRERGSAGALINVGSVVGDMPMPLSVAYSATKHAVKGFTDGLRIELMQEELPVSVTLIKPSSIDTQFFDHAKSEMGGLGKAPGPQYAPEVVAKAILYAAQYPKRHFPVGATAVVGPTAEQLAPGFVDRRQASLRLEDLVDFGHQPTARSLQEVPDEGEERSRFGQGRSYSVSTSAQLHPRLSAGVVGIGLVLAGFLAARWMDQPHRHAGRIH